MLRALTSSQGAQVEEGMCPVCQGDLQKVGLRIDRCFNCKRNYALVIEGEETIAKSCPECESTNWLLHHPKLSMTQCPQCGVLHSIGN